MSKTVRSDSCEPESPLFCPRPIVSEREEIGHTQIKFGMRREGDAVFRTVGVFCRATGIAAVCGTAALRDRGAARIAARAPGACVFHVAIPGVSARVAHAAVPCLRWRQRSCHRDRRSDRRRHRSRWPALVSAEVSPLPAVGALTPPFPVSAPESMGPFAGSELALLPLAVLPLEVAASRPVPFPAFASWELGADVVCGCRSVAGVRWCRFARILSR